MPSQPVKPSNAGIVTDEASGERHIPPSVRPDGSTRKAIKIRPGYRPPEDVELYKNRTAEGFRARQAQGGVPGAEGLKDDDDAAADKEGGSAASNKNAKRREARKRAKAAAEAGDAGDDKAADGGGGGEAKKEEKAQAQPEPVDPAAEREKKARNLKKKLKQAKELKDRKDGGQALLPEQIAKVIKINELIRELDALGFDSNGEPKGAAAEEGAPA